MIWPISLTIFRRLNIEALEGTYWTFECPNHWFLRPAGHYKPIWWFASRILCCVWVLNSVFILIYTSKISREITLQLLLSQWVAVLDRKPWFLSFWFPFLSVSAFCGAPPHWRNWDIEYSFSCPFELSQVCPKI